MNQPNSGSRLFLSYSRKDTAFARRIRTDLEQAGMDVWMDQQDLTPGSAAWTRTIKNQISSAASMIVICSPDADESDWVHKEILMAQGLGKPIYPVLAAGTANDRPIELMDHQYVDAIAGRYDDALGKLLTVLGRLPPPGPDMIYRNSGSVRDPLDFSAIVGIPYGATKNDVVALFGEPARMDPFPSGQEIHLVFESSLRSEFLLKTKHPAMSVHCDEQPPHRVNSVQLWGIQGWAGTYTLSDPRLVCLGQPRKGVIRIMGKPARENSPSRLSLLGDFPFGYKYSELFYSSTQGELRVHLSSDHWFVNPVCDGLRLYWKYATLQPD